MAKFYEAGKLICDGPRMSRCHSIGQSVRLNSTDYKVIASKLNAAGDDEEVDLERCEVCTKCGGIKGDLSRDNGCNPRWCR